MNKLRLKLLKVICYFLLPKDCAIVRLKGCYSIKYTIVSGYIDSRGVFQGKE